MSTVKDLMKVFWDACKETPKGMLAPFKAFWKVATHNPVLDRSEYRTNKHA